MHDGFSYISQASRPRQKQLAQIDEDCVVLVHLALSCCSPYVIYKKNMMVPFLASPSPQSPVRGKNARALHADVAGPAQESKNGMRGKVRTGA